MAGEKQHIVFFHPDLGIGGAERLVIDAAVGLQKPRPQAKEPSIVRVYGNTIVPSAIWAACAILCAILRQVHLIVHIALLSHELQHSPRPPSSLTSSAQEFLCYGLLLSHPRIIFYCHFPDKLLAKKGGFLKALYRRPFDWLESWNHWLQRHNCRQQPLHKEHFRRGPSQPQDPASPASYTHASISRMGRPAGLVAPLWEGKKVLLSINRFERKEDVALAIRAFAGCRPWSASRRGWSLQVDTIPECPRTSPRIPSYEIAVVFLHSVPGTFKSTLLATARLLIYTPLHEHFGIVPLEAMLAETPVLAANEGGPTETVVSGQTGWLRDVRKVQDWTERLKEMGARGRDRVIAEFSKEKLAERLDIEIQAMLQKTTRPALVPVSAVVLIVGLIGALAALGIILVLQK
ncbi:mannosyltransferase [Bipolaris maydis]|nr:mannosyltransferase [Bipolaris maydis]